MHLLIFKHDSKSRTDLKDTAVLVITKKTDKKFFDREEISRLVALQVQPYYSE